MAFCGFVDGILGIYEDFEISQILLIERGRGTGEGGAIVDSDQNLQIVQCFFFFFLKGIKKNDGGSWKFKMKEAVLCFFFHELYNFSNVNGGDFARR